jgi:AraC-like DNA-binding protein
VTVGNTSHRGILALPGRLPYRLDRLLPPEQLGWCVDRFWMTEWDIPQGRAVTARILPHPTVNLTLEGDGLVITGVASGVFARTLTGHGQVFGIKLRPGAARLLTDVPIRSLSGTGQPAEGLLAGGRQLASALREQTSDAGRATAFADHIAGLGLAPDADLMMVQRAVDLLVADAGVKRVADATRRLQISDRSLQRLFADYLGLTPGWVLRRGRLHAAAERLVTLAGRHSEPLAELAAEFGYADQAHLTNDFRRFIGMPPGNWLVALVREHSSGLSQPINPPS